MRYSNATEGDEGTGGKVTFVMVFNAHDNGSIVIMGPERRGNP